MQNVSFDKTGFTGQTNFIVIQYSMTKTDVPSSSWLHFQGNYE
jgi:hypothetical protein